MKKISTFLTIVALGATVSMSVLAMPAPANALGNKVKVNRTYNAAKNFHDTFVQEYNDLTALQTDLASETSTTTIAEAYATITDSIDAMEGTALRAKNKTQFLVFADRRERETLRSMMSAVLANLELHRADTQAAYDANDMSTLEVELGELVTYVNENQDEYGSQVRKYFKIMLDSAMVNTNDGLTAIAEIMTAYETLGADITTLEQRYNQALAAYNEAQTWYNAADDTTVVSEKARDYGKALWKLIVSRLWLASAQAAVNTLEAAQLNAN